MKLKVAVFPDNASGDLQRDVSALPNPFEDKIPHINEYTAQDIATLQHRLDKQLGPEYISSRPGAGGSKVYYLAGEKAINLANEVFGFNGWSSTIKNVQIDFVDEDRNTGKITLGLSIIVRVSLRDGTFHEDIGYGHIENCKGKAAAFEKAKKEAATDALKRALRNFGNLLGNCLYDRQYLQRVTKVKAEPSRWDIDNLHRHPDYTPIKKEPIANEPAKENGDKYPQEPVAAPNTTYAEGDYDEFGGDVFDETDMSHPDEVMLDSLMNENETLQTKTGTLPQAQQKQQIMRTHSIPALRALTGAQPTGPPNAVQNGAVSSRQDNAKPRITSVQTAHSMRASAMPPPAMPPNNQAGPQRPNEPQKPGSERQEPSIGFINSRAAEVLTKSETPLAQVKSVPAFNPHAESPSIRRTSGINHAKSEPISRKGLGGSNGQASEPTTAGALNGSSTGGPRPGMESRPTKNLAQGPANFVNPQSDPSRQIGMPSIPSPLANRGGYKPPAMKRPAPGNETPGPGGGPGRMPLTDVSNMAASPKGPPGVVEGTKGPDAAIGTDVGGDAKRSKISSSG